MSTVVVNGSDPDVYLTNGTRQALGLTGESTRPQSIVQAAQEGYYAATGEWPYVAGMPNTPPPPAAKTLGTVSITGSGISGGSVSLTTGDTLDMTAGISGDATDTTFAWTVRSGDCVSFTTGKNTSTETIDATKAGAATLRCTFTATASDSPKEATLSVVVTDPAKAMTASVTKAPTSRADDTASITIENTALKDRILSYGFQQDNTGGVDVQTVQIPAGTTAIQAATLLKNSVSDPEVTTTRASNVVTFAPKSGSFINKLTAALS